MGGRGGTSTSGSVIQFAGSIASEGRSVAVDITSNNVSAAQERTGSGSIEFNISSAEINQGESFGKLEARVNFKTETMSVKSIDVTGVGRGKGVGQRLYAAAIERAQTIGLRTFTSDSRVSEDADRAWRRLSTKIEATKNTLARWTGGQWATPNGSPVWRINLAAVAKSTLAKIRTGKL